MEDYFCDDVEPFLFILIKVEDDEIFYLSQIFKEEAQLTLDWHIQSNSMIEFIQQNQVNETLIIIDIIMLIYVKDKKIVFKTIWL